MLELDDRLRILLVCDSLDIGGAERHVVNLAIALRKRGHSVTIACSSEGVLAAQVRAVGIEVRPLLDGIVKRRLDRRYTSRLRQLIVQTSPDIVHAHLHASIVAASCAIEGTAPSFVITEHSEAIWRDSAAWSEALSAYARADAILAVSTRIADRLIATAAIDASTLHVVRNTLHCVPPVALSKRRDRSGGAVVGVVARLLPEKGVDVFLRAAAQIAGALPQTRFVVVGDGPERSRLLELTDSLGLRSRVRFLGARDEAASVIRKLDVLCVPSRSEGTPLVVLEAMAAGTPIVATAAGGIPEQVCHAREALLVAPEDDVALAAAVRRLLERPRLAQRLAAAARRRVTSEFAPERMVAMVEDVYRDCLPSKQPMPRTRVPLPAAATA
jgi:glycosyltransferase involved in cell wall biosynthesis